MKIEGIEVTFGADPEFAVYNQNKRMYVSPYDILPGTKAEPYRLKDGACQVDGMAAEFNVDPCQNAKELYEKSIFVKDQVLELMQQNTKDVLVLYPVCHVEFKSEYFNELPLEIREVGCSVDYSGHTGDELNSPVTETGRMRYFGGHIHVGFTDVKDPMEPSHLTECIYLMNSHSPFYHNIYMPRLFNAARTEEFIRYEVYRQRFRPKPYGIEIRTFGNTWLRSQDYTDAAVGSITAGFRYALRNGNQAVGF